MVMVATAVKKSTTKRTKASKMKEELKDHIPIPLGEGKTMMMPLVGGAETMATTEGGQPLELDEDAMQKLNSLNSKLSQMLKDARLK